MARTESLIDSLANSPYLPSQQYSTHNLDLRQRLLRVIHQIFDLPSVDLRDTEQQLPTQPQGHGSVVAALAHDVSDIGLKVGGEDILLGELALQVGSEPDASQRPCFGEESLGIEHAGGGLIEVDAARPMEVSRVSRKIGGRSCVVCDWRGALL